ncbi:hypothetical protein [uncultured Maritimibacter sp.]|uniref:hypothetical protein n=1 Tax=uncultured Maritimibacter sp. TaxID=991866 RepID=UPI000C0A6932|nr:hypothetical protein [Maritimibacter sp.]|tara:strand:+ start:10319 stop:10672 length:354 start_codon:yes stop_codon:yes gene_type:complete
MRHIAALAAIAVTCTACMETDGGSSLQTGSGNDTAAGSVRGSVSARPGGGYTFLLNRDRTVCTAVFDDAASAGATELSDLNCSGGNEGTATIIYGSDATPDRVIYAVNGVGGGTINL